MLEIMYGFMVSCLWRGDYEIQTCSFIHSISISDNSRVGYFFKILVFTTTYHSIFHIIAPSLNKGPFLGESKQEGSEQSYTPAFFRMVERDVGGQVGKVRAFSAESFWE